MAGSLSIARDRPKKKPSKRSHVDEAWLGHGAVIFYSGLPTRRVDQHTEFQTLGCHYRDKYPAMAIESNVSKTHKVCAHAQLNIMDRARPGHLVCMFTMQTYARVRIIRCPWPKKRMTSTNKLYTKKQAHKKTKQALVIQAIE